MYVSWFCYLLADSFFYHNLLAVAIVLFFTFPMYQSPVFFLFPFRRCVVHRFVIKICAPWSCLFVSIRIGCDPLPDNTQHFRLLFELFIFHGLRVTEGNEATSSSSSWRGDCSGGVADSRRGCCRRSPSILVRHPLVRGRSALFVFVRIRSPF
jgi:hypothetical protein